MKKGHLKRTNIDIRMLLAKIDVKSEKKTKYIAEKLYNISKIGDVFAFTGDVGVGKTTLIRYFIRKGGKENIITSPTYNIYFKYSSKKSTIFHLDAWRLKSDEEIINLGVTDFFYKSIFLIEWAEKIERFLPRNKLNIHIEYKKKNRIIYFKGDSSWVSRIKDLPNGY
ncbi:MAG: tRNA (adenosine(37)-N6)-threonylcarbamoyltransferase complex ATPase subunit type 1 TsaE [Rickettsiales bacterium]|nr:tRNA (adenosine(37)-N6)-threonylcarbamoyltransferase complex ATPase subunit type 1 TsaE [Rickettsiales bacterium]|tara:strand:- start:342 stop:845 length:504 start_codon:yes stop_codon:yes gene_type:complete